MKLLHKIALSLAAVAALSFATPANARVYYRHGGVYHGRVVYGAGFGYPYYYGPGYYADWGYPYYGYYGPYYGYYGPYYGGVGFAFGGHGYYGHGGYRGGYRGGRGGGSGGHHR